MATIKSVVSIEAKSKGFKSAVTDVDSLTRGTTRLGNASSAAGRAFAAQSKGLGGLVAAYAGAAATIFALQQAFSALNQAAKNEQLIQGTKTLASAVGQSGDKILNTLQKITKAQISVAASAEQANAALAAGFSGEQIEQLASIASKASKALGRDLTDAFSRLIRGAGKLEPELLDELGIFTRLEHSVGLYANQLGKAATTLTQFERRQAFVNSVIEEGNRKFTSISISEATAAQNLSKLVATLANLGQAVGGFIANALNPLVEFFNNNLFNSIALFGVLAATVFGKAVSLMKEGAISLSKSLEETNIKVANFFTSTKQQNALLEVQNAAAKINSNQVRGASNAGLRNAINATKDEVTFAEALIAKQEAQLKIKRNDAEILRAENTIAGSRASEAGKQKARETVTRLSNMNLVLTDIVSATDKAVESQNRLAKSIQGTISRISAVFSAVLFYGSKLLGWIGFAITAFSVLQLVLDKFGVSDTFDGILTSISRGVASMLGFTESVKKANESVNSLGQSLFNALASDGKLDINKATAVKGQSWLAKRLGIDPESVKFTEELISKEIQTLTKKFKDITTERSKEIANQENIFNQTMRSATGRTGVAPTAEYQQPFLEQKDKNIMEIDLNSIKATAAAIGELTKTYQELNGEGAKTVHFIIKAAEESHRLSQEGPDALADLKTAADETGISFEKLFKFFSIGDNKLSSTSQFLPNFEPSITSYAEFNELRKLGARNEIAARQEINERELAFVRLLNVAVDLQADVVTGLASEEALSAKLGALRNVELEITKQIANIKLQPTTDEELIKLYSDQVELLQKRLDIIANTTKQIRVQAEYQIAISQQTEKLKKSFSEEFNAASQITGVLSKQAMFAQSALEIRANELEQLSVVLDNTAEVRKLESEGVKLKNSQIALSREGIVAEQILFGLAVKVSQEQKKIIDDLKKQNTDASNKLRAAQLQQELVVIQNKQKYSELAFDVVEKELGLKQEQLNVSQKIEEITIRTSNLLRKTTLALLGELASGPLSNLFSSENNRNIEISIAENDLEEFRRINESQIKLAQYKAANDKALLLN